MLSVGESRIELLEAADADSVIAKFIEKRGEGIHHIAITVPDLNAAVERLKANGTVIYLHAMPELLRERTRRSRHRPLLNAADPIARLAELYAARDALYREVASMTVESNREEISHFSRRLEAALHDSPPT